VQREKTKSIGSRFSYCELNASLLGWCESEDMRVCTLIYTFENGQVGDNTTCVKVLESLILLGGGYPGLVDSR
jgi:hypothetical protein